MKTIAFYLPQYHRIPENDEWWGVGYTEWTAVRKAKPMYEGHDQPKIPFENNYYNLLEKETMEWQAELIKDYGVDGLCFYHYYFSKGRKILEKPAENLLKWTDIDIPFCFSWANETWARTWSLLSYKNVWNSIEEKEIDIPNKQEAILLKQEYGDESDWQIHFNYLLPFFKDSRYIKNGNSPLFIIHRPDLVSCLPQMMDLWNELAKKAGFDGIYFVGSNTSMTGLDGYIRQEPNFSYDFNQFRFDYGEITKKVIKNAIYADENTFLCGFPAYDDTPRRGKNGKLIGNSTPEKFYKQMRTIYSISHDRNLEYVFINAWNEWGEGMYLEPDSVNGYRYLEMLKKAKEDRSQGVLTDICALNDTDYSLVRNLQQELAKNKEKVRVISRIAMMGDLTKNVQEYLERYNLKRLAIYGMGDVARTFLANLPDGILKYIVDKNDDHIASEYPVFGIEKELPEVDLIVVCLPIYFISVYRDLRKITMSRVISLDQFLDEVEE